MGAYLIDHPPVLSQYRARTRPLTGLTVLHSSESVMDTVGPDTGAEAVAEFIRQRKNYGSYHDLCDSDSRINLVPYELAAFQDGTGSNGWALSISFALSTSDWRRMTPERRTAFLRSGARAFAAQQAWRRAHDFPLTQLRYITKAQSDAGLSGFIAHGLRDPERRSDPGVSTPNLFPFTEWLKVCAAATTTAPQEDDDMATLTQENLDAIARAVVDRQVSGDRPLWKVLADLDSRDPHRNPVAQAVVDRPVAGDVPLWQVLAGLYGRAAVDAAAVAELLRPAIVASMAEVGAGATVDQLADELAARLVA